jgi:predicted transcriptional regulator/plasmid maintenance system antidote protein VapI
MTQSETATALGVSPSYLNLLERNQRPVTARVLLALADVFDVDVRAFAKDSDRQLLSDLQEAAADPVLASLELDRIELSELADSHPRAAEAFARLYQSYREGASATADLASRMTGPGAGASGPGTILEDVRDAIDSRQNHYPELESAAELLIEKAKLESRHRDVTLSSYLTREYGFTVKVLDEDTMGGLRRRLDFHGRRLLLCESIPLESRPFQITLALASLELGDTLDQLCDQASLPSDEARKLYRIGLCSYFAAAVLMPYAEFLQTAETTRYDLERLQRRFETSYEQVCHRLTTLQRNGARGIPFFMVRIDLAGNVSKRFGGGIMPFARSGGGCPKWNLYDALRTPVRILTQSFELPDGTRHLSIARAQSHPGPNGQSPLLHSVAVGCDWSHADKICHADGIAQMPPIPVGISCRLCEREDCAQRAFPPLRRKLSIDPHQLHASPFAFGRE